MGRYFIINLVKNSVYVNLYRKTLLEIHVIYLGNKDIYCIFKSFCIISVLCSTKFCLFHSFILFYSNNKFFINHVLQFKYLPGLDKRKLYVVIFVSGWCGGL